ncbi:MAG: hypothetical protein K2X57_12950 [Xanthobacteraceae bacterium]|nr:hypothetical protein [Xanthobacteraceae bacterium]
MLKMMTAALTCALSVAPACAQVLIDSEVCTRLQRAYPPGLYVVHPLSSNVVGNPGRDEGCTSDGDLCVRGATGPAYYDPQARFYYKAVPSANRPDAGREAAWHVRTQTIADGIADADAAYVTRPAKRTQCSPDSDLPTLEGENRYVSTRRYIDYHGDKGRRGPDPELSRSFHFKLENDDSTGTCIGSDDDSLGGLDRAYGFKDVARTTQRVERVAQSLLEPTGANAGPRGQVMNKFAGLSSEFAYRRPGAVDCFGFTLPLPTRRDRMGVATWKPQTTLVVIKRVRPGSVEPLLETTVRWVGQ